MDYEWDDAKAAANRCKHGVAFEDAIPALQDPNRVEDLDGRFIYGELRMRIIGMACDRVLFVDHPAQRELLPHHFGPESDPT